METVSQPEVFDDIRPLVDAEVSETIERLLSEPNFRKAVESFIQPLTWEQFCAAMRDCKTVYDFQRNIIYPTVIQLMSKTTEGVKGENWENLLNQESHLVISNHRDIVLDAGFLNIMLFDKNSDTTEIAIGDNLLIYPWITDLVRLNKSFIVRRNVSMREMLLASKHLSEYIHYTINERKQSIWLAQREGRAKDSNDKTQTSLLKMLTLIDTENPLQALKALRIVPLAISYELDPCDYLKAKEFQMKRDNPEHKKSKADDIENMATGIKGYKGNVSFRFGAPINDQLSQIDPQMERGQIVDIAANMIDTEIYKNYVFFPFNYVAYDLMTNTHTFQSEYSEEDKQRFEAYIDGQIKKIDIENKDYTFLRMKMIEMYGNTVKNHLTIIG